MSKAKTAMAQHIEHLNIMINEVKNRKDADPLDVEAILCGLETAKENAVHFLTEEESQIKQAYLDGIHQQGENFNINKTPQTPDEYFESKYSEEDE